MKRYWQKFLGFLRRDWPTKSVMIILAIALWVTVSIMQSKTGLFPGAIEIKARNTPTGTVAILSQKYAEVRISADSNTWQNLQPDDMELYVDLAGFSTGTYEFTVKSVSLVNQVAVTDVNPEKIFVTIEPIITKELPVNLEIEGLPGQDFVLDSYRIDPEIVTVVAPKNYIADTKQVTAKLSLDGETSSFTRYLDLTIPSLRSDLMQSVTIGPARIKVSVTISAGGESKTVGIKPEISGQPSSGYYVSAVTATPATINISGPAAVLSTINTISTEAIDITSITDNKTFSVPVIFPDNTSSATRRIEVVVSISKTISP